MSDRTYLILEGEGCSYFGGEEKQHEETVRVKKDYVLLIPKGTAYDYEGHMRLFLTLTSLRAGLGRSHYGGL